MEVVWNSHFLTSQTGYSPGPSVAPAERGVNASPGPEKKVYDVIQGDKHWKIEKVSEYFVYEGLEDSGGNRYSIHSAL